MRARFHWTSSAVGDIPAPKNDSAIGVASLQFEPCIERIHRASGEKVSDLSGSHHHVHAYGSARLELRAGRIERRRYLAYLPDHRVTLLLRFFADGECGIHARGVVSPQHGGVPLVILSGRRRENIDGDESRFQKFFGRMELLFILICKSKRSVRTGKAMRVHLAIPVTWIARVDQRHVTIGARL